MTEEFKEPETLSAETVIPDDNLGVVSSSEQLKEADTETSESLDLASESFLQRRINQIKNGYEGLSDKQKDVLQIGAMALSTTVLPVVAILSGHNIESSKLFLEGEGLLAFGALEVGAAMKVRKMLRRLRN